MEATDTSTPAEPTSTVGDFIRRRRLALGMSQSDLGQKIGKHQAWASQRECGHAPVRSEDIPSLAAALQVDAAELLAVSGIQQQPADPKAEAATARVGVLTEETVTTQ